MDAPHTIAALVDGGIPFVGGVYATVVGYRRPDPVVVAGAPLSRDERATMILRKLGPFLALFGVAMIVRGVFWNGDAVAPSVASEVWSWHGHSCVEGGFSADFPGSPTEAMVVQPTTAGELTIHRFEVSKYDGKMGFSCSYRVYSAAMISAGLLPTLDAAADAVAAMPGRSMVRKTEVQMAGQPAREVLVDAEQGYRILMRLSIIDEVMYTAMVVRPKDWADSPEEVRFLDSFRLLPR